MTEQEIMAAHDEAIERIRETYRDASIQWIERRGESPGHGADASSIAVIASNGVGLFIVIETGESR